MEETLRLNLNKPQIFEYNDLRIDNSIYPQEIKSSRTEEIESNTQDNDTIRIDYSVLPIEQVLAHEGVQPDMILSRRNRKALLRSFNKRLGSFLKELSKLKRQTEEPKLIGNKKFDQDDPEAKYEEKDKSNVYVERKQMTYLQSEIRSIAELLYLNLYSGSDVRGLIDKIKKWFFRSKPLNPDLFDNPAVQTAPPKYFVKKSQATFQKIYNDLDASKHKLLDKKNYGIIPIEEIEIWEERLKKIKIAFEEVLGERDEIGKDLEVLKTVLNQLLSELNDTRSHLDKPIKAKDLEDGRTENAKHEREINRYQSSLKKIHKLIDSVYKTVPLRPSRDFDFEQDVVNALSNIVELLNAPSSKGLFGWAKRGDVFNGKKIDWDENGHFLIDGLAATSIIKEDVGIKYDDDTGNPRYMQTTPQQQEAGETKRKAYEEALEFFKAYGDSQVETDQNPQNMQTLFHYAIDINDNFKIFRINVRDGDQKEYRGKDLSNAPTQRVTISHKHKNPRYDDGGSARSFRIDAKVVSEILRLESYIEHILELVDNARIDQMNSSINAPVSNSPLIFQDLDNFNSSPIPENNEINNQITEMQTQINTLLASGKIKKASKLTAKMQKLQSNSS